MSLGFSFLWFWFSKAWVFAQMSCIEFFLKGFVGCFWHNTLFFQNREYTHRLNELISFKICLNWIEIYYKHFTFSIKSMQACKSKPKFIISQTIPSFWYSSCSKTNIKWLKNCCNLSFVKLMQSCSKPLYFNSTILIKTFLVLMKVLISGEVIHQRLQSQRYLKHQ